MPKVSIVVPCYGVEKYLNRCIESLINQTLRDIEIILVDDGSPDKVPEMCDEWAKMDSRIKVIHKQNAGLGFARNSGLDCARGEYIAFVDSDDYIDLAMYNTLYDIAKNKDLDAVFCGFEKEYAENKFRNIQECSEYIEFANENVKRLIPDFVASSPYCKREYKYEMSVWHSLYKREIIEDNAIKFVSERDFVSEDIPFQIDFLEHAKKISFIPDVLYHYCYNNGSLSKKISREKFDKIKALYNLLERKCLVYDPKALRAKRLFIGYVRSYIRTLVNTSLTRKEKKFIIKDILQDSIWEKICSYKLSYLPIRQRFFLFFFYNKQFFLTYCYAKLMELIK